MLRLYVNVPQAYAQLIKTGQEVTITQPELAGLTFQGKVARTGASIDAATRTMQVEITLPNKDGTLLPGAYVQVGIPLQGAQGTVISANTLMIRGDGIRVAVVDAEGRVKLALVKIGRNLGEAVEVLDGVGPKDRLVLNPSDSLADGDKVAIAPAEPAGGRGAKGGKGDDGGATPADPAAKKAS
jgi:RND family efflux transporter MFP subunit